jgi:hypothetical protein
MRKRKGMFISRMSEWWDGICLGMSMELPNLIPTVPYCRVSWDSGGCEDVYLLQLFSWPN